MALSMEALTSGARGLQCVCESVCVHACSVATALDKTGFSRFIFSSVGLMQMSGGILPQPNWFSEISGSNLLHLP